MRRFVGLTTIAFTIVLAVTSWTGSAEGQSQLLASGQVSLPVSQNGPNDPEFNFPVRGNHTLPGGLGATAGARLVLALRDLTRPGQTCPNDDFGGLIDPGCATVDWPFTGRRGTNLVGVQLTSGVETFHLRRTGGFSSQPEPSNQ